MTDLVRNQRSRQWAGDRRPSRPSPGRPGHSRSANCPPGPHDASSEVINVPHGTVAKIWILAASQQPGESSLVRADDITHLIASHETLSASRVASDTFITLVHRDQETKYLPENFDLALLVEV